MNSANLCSLARRYDNTIPPRFLAPIDSLKIPAQNGAKSNQLTNGGRGVSAFGRDNESVDVWKRGALYSVHDAA